MNSLEVQNIRKVWTICLNKFPAHVFWLGAVHDVTIVISFWGLWYWNFRKVAANHTSTVRCSQNSNNKTIHQVLKSYQPSKTVIFKKARKYMVCSLPKHMRNWICQTDLRSRRPFHGLARLSATRWGFTLEMAAWTGRCPSIYITIIFLFTFPWVKSAISFTSFNRSDCQMLADLFGIKLKKFGLKNLEVELPQANHLHCTLAIKKYQKTKKSHWCRSGGLRRALLEVGCTTIQPDSGISYPYFLVNFLVNPGLPCHGGILASFEWGHGVSIYG